MLLLGAVATDVVTTAQLVALPTTLFLVVYLGCTAAAARILRGPVRVAAAVAFVAVLGVLAFTGWAVLLGLLVIVGTYFRFWPPGRRRPRAVGRVSP